MIPFKEAYNKVLSYPIDLGVEVVSLMNSSGRILAENIKADRDFPPFNRVTKDGIAISYAALANGVAKFRIEGIASAGMQQQQLQDQTACLEVMTGAVLPLGTDTVIMYEHITITKGWVVIDKTVTKGQNIHYKGSDETQGAEILKKGQKITPAEIGVMASVGADKVQVQALPKVCTISTGNELVNVAETPKPHQIRKSNSITLQVALSKLGIAASALHLKDEKPAIKEGLEKALQANDVLLLSGGVSKGKYDFIPEVMDALGVQKIFHRVAQRPGKPFWFGFHKEHNTVIFSFPGNPVSTFANYHIYFLPWLSTSWNVPVNSSPIRLSEELQINPPLTRFIQVKTHWKDGALYATLVVENGSGDLTSLAKSDGFICLEPRKAIYKLGERVIFVPTR
ncbi:molybdopterin molybdotransferase MoeA [Maribacter sp. R77961]|uniref:molybdopterin molybdotransferase MoeA n=1 Tax=Maribacter sp. R77961 TaxID=3093871 RepID=UPI0037C73565